MHEKCTMDSVVQHFKSCWYCVTLCNFIPAQRIFGGDTRHTKHYDH
jgi:hypothetical protein